MDKKRVLLPHLYLFVFYKNEYKLFRWGLFKIKFFLFSWRSRILQNFCSIAIISVKKKRYFVVIHTKLIFLTFSM